jgi:hypothetical protein
LPGFLSEYEGTERVELGGGYWVDIKRCLSRAEYQRVQDLLGAGKQTINMSGTRLMQMDVGGSQEEMLFQSITDWNLDDENGVKWPLSPEKDKRANIRRMPASAFNDVFAACDELNGPRAGKEAAQFPEGPVDGAADGEEIPAGT